MMNRRSLLMLCLATLATPASAESTFSFPSIDGGTIDLSALRGKPVLVVNTASMCAYTPQYDQLQALHEAYADRATILAVPSDDFGSQELDTAEQVKEFCEVNFNLTLPMTDITVVRGRNAHPFFRWAADQGAVPHWNFHKFLLDADGRLVQDFPTQIRPDSTRITAALDALL